MRRAPLLFLAVAALGACTATPDAATVPLSAAAAAPPAPPAPSAAPVPATMPCAERLLGPRCEAALAKGEAESLGARIEAAQKAVLESRFADVQALVRLAKLQLRRDEDTPGPDGPTDAARALRTAARAVAVDGTSAEARLVLALALARSLFGAVASADPRVRGAALDLVTIALRGSPTGGAAPVRAATATLEQALTQARGDSSPEPSPHLTPGPVAPPAPPLPRCSAAESAAASSSSYCAGLAHLASASAAADRGAAAAAILDGWRALEPLCARRDPGCPPHVGEGLAAAARAFHAAGATAKSIAAARLVLEPGRVPAAPYLQGMLCVEIGDRYHALGIFEQAAEWYERADQLGQAWGVRRAEAIRKALRAGTQPAPPVRADTGCRPKLVCVVRQMAGEAW